jgi:hypothetical protein
MLDTTTHATPPHSRSAANNQRPHKPHPHTARTSFAGSFKLVRRKLSFVQPPQPPKPQRMPSLKLAPSAEPPEHDVHSAQHAFRELCLRTD